MPLPVIPGDGEPLTIRPGQCQAWTGMFGGLGCSLNDSHDLPGLDRRHRDPRTGWPWHREPGGALVLGPPDPAVRPVCGARYRWLTPAGDIELGCDGGHGAGDPDRHRDPVTGWHWWTGDGLLTVEARP